jgi:hypothetical protein
MTYYMQTSSGDVFVTNYPEYHKDCTQLKKAEGGALYRKQTKEGLLKILKPGDAVYCIVRSVSASGMSRTISLFVIDGEHFSDVTHSAAIVMGDKLAKNGALRVNGCGMDMCFATVYNLGRYLWPNGTPEPHGMRNGEPDSYGGYALKHRTI